jgi:hypothetical protein
VPFAEHSAEANCGIFRSYPRERCTKTRSGKIDGLQDRPKDASRGPKAISFGNLFEVESRSIYSDAHTVQRCTLTHNASKSTDLAERGRGSPRRSKNSSARFGVLGAHTLHIYSAQTQKRAVLSSTECAISEFDSAQTIGPRNASWGVSFEASAESNFVKRCTM